MANIGGYRGWHLCAEHTGSTSNSISVKAWIHADSQYSCAWGARTMTVTCNGKTQTAGINAMNNSGNASSNVVYFTFSGLAASTSYRVNFSYDVRATLSGSYQGTWTGYLDISTSAPPTASFNLNILNPDGSEPWSTGEAGSVEQSINGGGYSRVSNESASSYNIGTTFAYRNFSPGTGRHLSSVSGLDSSWRATLGSGGLTVSFNTAWDTYTISYNANGGSGAPGSQTKTYGQNLTLSNTKPSKSSTTTSGYTVTFNGNGGTPSKNSATATDTLSYSFSNWNTNSSGTGTSYNSGGIYSSNSAATLYAQYSTSRSRGSISLATASRSLYDFLGWNSSSTASSGITGSYTPSSNTTLYAVWRASKPTGISHSVSNIKRTTADVSISYTGVEISNIKVYYKKTSETSWNSVDANLSTKKATLTNLSANTNYNVYVKVTNPGGSTDSSSSTFITLGNPPTSVGCTISNVFDYSVEIRCAATADANASIAKYELINPDTNVVWKSGTGSLFYLTDVKDETTYRFKVKAYDNFNRSTISTDVYTFTTMKAKWVKVIDSTGSVKEYRTYRIDANGNKTEIRKRFVHLLKK